jgi:Cu/Ag efflux protein CusF
MCDNKKLFALMGLFGFFIPLLIACGGKTPGAEDGPSSTARSYTVRGEVRSLPQPDDPASSFQLHHEAIPEFVGIDGEVVGMTPMTMPFPVQPGQLPAGIAVGDAVAMTFRVDWEGSPAIEVVEIKTLPPETELRFAP